MCGHCQLEGVPRSLQADSTCQLLLIWPWSSSLNLTDALPLPPEIAHKCLVHPMGEFEDGCGRSTGLKPAAWPSSQRRSIRLGDANGESRLPTEIDGRW